MGQHFDAVVVDCDNEQNATLLFKSARNSTSNQTSLAVAVVEGQAGVAKAFRIGANLVLTKPINIEQAKGTLRVARGLLRKSDPAKPAAAAPVAAPAPKAPPAKPVAAKPVAPVRPAVPAATAAVSTPRPAAPPVAKPAPIVAKPATAAASSVPVAPADDPLEVKVDQPVAAPRDEVPVFNKFGVPASQAAKLPSAAAPSAVAEVKPAFKAGLPVTPGGGAASAPAPAREVHDSQVAEIPPTPAPAPVEAVVDQPAVAAQSESPSFVGSAPSFTFGGANVQESSGGGNKKIFLGVAAAVLLAAALYVGWTQFKGHASQPVNTQAPTAPLAEKPGSAKPAPAISTTPAPAATNSAAAPAASASVPSSQPAAAPAKTEAADNTDTASADASVPSSSKPSSSTPPVAGKPALAANTAAAPLVLKGGTAPVLRATSGAPAASEAPAPSMVGIAATGAGAPPPNLVAGGSAPKPILQMLNVSQGVSQGLLFKKVQPTYPKNALLMRVEGAVELMATISRTGDITQVKVLSGNPQLTRAAADAVKQWKYKPYLLNGEPVEIQTQVTVNFKLPN
jgi:protein TonB